MPGGSVVFTLAWKRAVYGNLLDWKSSIYTIRGWF